LNRNWPIAENKAGRSFEHLSVAPANSRRRCASIRELGWDTMKPNFYMDFLARQRWMLSQHFYHQLFICLKPKKTWLNTLVKKYPGTTFWKSI